MIVKIIIYESKNIYNEIMIYVNLPYLSHSTTQRQSKYRIKTSKNEN